MHSTLTSKLSCDALCGGYCILDKMELFDKSKLTDTIFNYVRSYILSDLIKIEVDHTNCIKNVKHEKMSKQLLSDQLKEYKFDSNSRYLYNHSGFQLIMTCENKKKDISEIEYLPPNGLFEGGIQYINGKKNFYNFY